MEYLKIKQKQKTPIKRNRERGEKDQRMDGIKEKIGKNQVVVLQTILSDQIKSMAQLYAV